MTFIPPIAKMGILIIYYTGVLVSVLFRSKIMAAKNLTFLAKILPRIFCWVAYGPQLQELLHQPGDMTHPRWQGRGEISNVAGLPLFHPSGDFGEAMAFLHTNAQVGTRQRLNTSYHNISPMPAGEQENQGLSGQNGHVEQPPSPSGHLVLIGFQVQAQTNRRDH